MLEAFYTDAVGNVGLGRLLSHGRHLPVVGLLLQRLANRRVPPRVAAKTVSFATATILDLALKRDFVGQQMLRRGFGRATAIYSSLGWGRTFLKEARRQGIPVVVELYVRPSLWKTYQAEYRAFPGWERAMPLVDCENAVGTERDPCLVANYVIVPAEGVREDVASTHGFPKERIFVVPYGVGEAFFQINNKPVRGRILFAGSCCLGKGIHYLAMAAQILAAQNKDYEFRVAGHASELVRGQGVCQNLNFLGRVPRNQISLEYESADVFVLPTLSEGSASVTYEALAAGIPVITTPVAGSVVRDGVEGRIIPERDPVAIADALEQIIENRMLRDRMADAARERANAYTQKRYGERLVAALEGFRL